MVLMEKANSLDILAENILHVSEEEKITGESADPEEMIKVAFLSDVENWYLEKCKIGLI